MIAPEDKDSKVTADDWAQRAKWAMHGSYLKEMFSRIQKEWDRILIKSRVYPTPGSGVRVKVTLNHEGKITNIVDFQSTSSEFGKEACIQAIVSAGPYGKWTPSMIGRLGSEQVMTFTFYYQ